MRASQILALVTVLIISNNNAATAQSLYGQRLRSIDGQWTLPTATRLLGSTDDDHVQRGSINSWDLSASVGSPVFAAAPGQVSYVDCFGYEQKRSGYHQGYGCAVDVSHGNGIVSQYAHCKQGTFYVKVGDMVTTDSLLCQVGTTGQTSWPHVHFTILRNGSPIRIASIFDINQMRYCKFCRATNDPNAPVTGAVSGQVQPATTAVQSPLTPVLKALAALSDQELTYLSFVLIFALMAAFWLANNALRVIMAAGLTAAACSALTITMLIPAQVTTTTGSSNNVPADFDTAYRIVRGQEGKGCDTYIVRTLNGITQWTYDRYNRERGTPRTDVCNNLTEQEAKDIYYRYYWKPSSLDGVAMAIAIQVFDHSINAGVGKGKEILASCGNNATCVAQRRRNFYNSTTTCKTKSVVCGAWLRRVDSVYRKATGNAN